MKKILLALFLLLLFFYSPIIDAAVYRVDADGAGEYTTIAQINARTFDPGDWVLFNYGDTWNERLVIPSSGTVDNHIYFGAYGNSALALPKIAGNGSNNTSVYSKNKSYITFDRLHIANSKNASSSTNTHYGAMLIEGDVGRPTSVWLHQCLLTNGIDNNIYTATFLKVNDIRIVDSSIYGGNTGVQFAAGTWTTAMNVLVTDSNIYGQSHGTAEHWDGIQFTGLFNADIERNNFYSWGEDAIDAIDGEGTYTINRNRFHNNNSKFTESHCWKSVTTGHTAAGTFSNNEMIDLAGNATSRGIYVTLSATSTYQIYNNICRNITDQCALIFGGINHKIYNNTFVGNLRGANISAATGVILQNNILSGSSSDLLLQSAATVTGGYNIVVQHSSVNQNSGTTYSGSANDKYSTNPLLTTPYTLQNSSPAIDAGTNTYCPATDINGKPRPIGSSCDIGASEYGTWIGRGALYRGTIN